MTFAEYSKKSRLRIETRLVEFIAEKKRENIPEAFKRQQALEVLEEFALRGKLIRGTLYLLSVELLGGKITTDHVDVACSIELIHSALLIQDDIIDHDVTRRGAPTVFYRYQGVGEKNQALDAYHYGVSIAIIVADAAIFLAFSLLSNFKGNSFSSLLHFISNEIYYVSLAEGVDSDFGQFIDEPLESEITAVNLYKTARYTFSLPFVAACIALEKEDQRDTLQTIGEKAGLIFQVKDDRIGLFGDEGEIGKPVGSDIRENKKTIIRLMLLSRVSQEERKSLMRIFGSDSVGEDQIKTVRSLVNKYKIQEDLDIKIADEMKHVWALYENLQGIEEFKQVLKGLLEFNLSRTS